MECAVLKLKAEMKLARLGPAIGVFAAAGLPAQPHGFPIAAVKASFFNGMATKGRYEQRISVTPDRGGKRNLGFANCVQWAYNVAQNQGAGPGWIDSRGYYINAKAAAAVKEEEVRLRRQALLADRLKMAFHREIGDLPVLKLTLSSDGVKMKQPERARAQFTDELRAALEGLARDERV